MASLGKLPFVSSFAAFLTRAFDQIRMAAISRARLHFTGSHAGIATGEDGPSQMGLEDLALFRSIPGSVVLQAADATSVWRCVELAAKAEGISYLRVVRPKLPVLYDRAEAFEIGGSHTLRVSSNDRVTLVASGATVHEVLQAADLLGGENIPTRVIDCYSVKPLDRAAIAKAAHETGRMVVVEDHYPEGGLGDAVSAALALDPVRVHHLAVQGVPQSGSPKELYRAFEIDAPSIAEAARLLAD